MSKEAAGWICVEFLADWRGVRFGMFAGERWVMREDRIDEDGTFELAAARVWRRDYKEIFRGDRAGAYEARKLENEDVRKRRCEYHGCWEKKHGGACAERAKAYENLGLAGIHD